MTLQQIDFTGVSSKSKTIQQSNANAILDSLTAQHCLTDIDWQLPVHHIVEQWVQRTPDNVALVFEHAQLTYAELNERANKVAHALLEQGVQPDTIVVVCINRSLELFISLLGILKAGAAYLPIDPLLPDERVHFMLTEAEPRVVLTERSVQARFSSVDATVWCIESASFNNFSHQNPPASALPNNLAYVIYTSGSTGAPKGTLLEHAGLSNFCRDQNVRHCLTESSRVLQFASIGFDAGTWEWTMALTSGATLVIISNEVARSPSALADVFKNEKVSHTFLTPAILTYLEDYRETHFASLQYLMVGGEAYSIELAITWYQGRNFINVYGPTETTICVTMKSYRGESTLSMGAAIDNCFTLVIDQHGEEQAIGEVGELYIGGIGLARGYLKQPTLTDSRFVRLANFPQHRLYRTGDLVRRLDHGEIEFVGRVDDQVKVNGYRIELGEIEHQLTKIDGIENAVVLAKNLGADKSLVAYIVMKKGSHFDRSQTKPTLSRFLPYYMLPALFVELNAFPLTFNRKIDKQLLQRMPIETSDQTTERDVSQSDSTLIESDVDLTASTQTREGIEELEVQLLAILRPILGVEKIDLYDNFYELGGDSIKTMRLVVQLRKSLGINFPISKLLTVKNFKELAAGLLDIKYWTPLYKLYPLDVSEKAQSNSAQSLKKEVNEAQAALKIFLIHPGAGTLECFREFVPILGQKLNRAEHLPVTIYGLQAKGLEPDQEPLDRIDAIVDLYLAQIIRAQEAGPLVLMGYCMGGYVALELARRLWEQGRGEDVKSVAIINSYATQKLTALGVLDANGDFTIKGEIRILESVFERENVLAEWGMTEEIFACFDHEQRMRFAYTKALETKAIPADITLDYVKRRFAVLAGLSKAMMFKTDAPLRAAIDNGFRIPILCLIAKENIYDYQQEWEDFGLPNVCYQYLPGSAGTIFESQYIENMAQTIIAGTPVLAELSETAEMAVNMDD